MMPSGVDTLDLCQSTTVTLSSEWKRDSPHYDVSYCSERMHKIKYYQLSYVILGSALYLVV